MQQNTGTAAVNEVSVTDTSIAFKMDRCFNPVLQDFLMAACAFRHIFLVQANSLNKA
jgi:hypothetical protein